MKNIIGLILLTLATQYSYAANEVVSHGSANEAAKEDTSPPEAEGPITLEQIPILSSIETKKMPPTPPPPAPAPSGVPAAAPQAVPTPPGPQPAPQALPTTPGPQPAPQGAPGAAIPPTSSLTPTTPMSYAPPTEETYGAHLTDKIPDTEILN